MAVLWEFLKWLGRRLFGPRKWLEPHDPDWDLCDCDQREKMLAQPKKFFGEPESALDQVIIHQESCMVRVAERLHSQRSG